MESSIESSNATDVPPSEKTMSIKAIRGLRSYYPSDKGPIDTYQLGQNGRVEYVAAEIAVDHLTKGKKTTEQWQKWAKEKGQTSDEVGLILSHRLGGSGIDQTNLFPKSPLLDDTTWKQHEEEAVEEASEMKKWKKIKFSVRLDYPTEDSMRPSSLEYQYDLPSGSILYGKVKNTAAKDSAASVEKEEEEEVEEEEEEEEEEVEEEEDADVPEEVMVVRWPAPKEQAEPDQPAAKQEEETTEVISPITTVILPPTPRPSLVEESPSPPPPPPPVVLPPPSKPIVEMPAQDAPVPREEPLTNEKATSKEKGTGGKIITTSDLINLIPVVGSCKLAYETVHAAVNGNGRMALRKAVQCSISLVADFYLGRAIARHGKILSNSVTEETIVRFVSKAENQIIIVTTFKATNQIISTISSLLS